MVLRMSSLGICSRFLGDLWHERKAHGVHFNPLGSFATKDEYVSKITEVTSRQILKKAYLIFHDKTLVLLCFCPFAACAFSAKERQVLKNRSSWIGGSSSLFLLVVISSVCCSCLCHLNKCC
ncbi:hypothetical protein PanWU01x14_221590 [Parasponia andersonii]|uniref:Uncharacterized protein n=1 Tax=Parasponia andersonii TaxID=3476 RepID=A0A2P5BP98_PARAD|nr:hypothetical protein PanWU01x14_221590 [Parasponia andersonii]